eukprot:TRINITY_DN5237_c0_g1_i6.p1 TRINITY_DN5237_c0_g1~~TRINITY_DN5237_c0_g1_i6.p1  ORF type:complete len:164 (+),score=37.23 TRINITY_DN5237_c0_g1_i6:27-494(+)
MCIRDRYQRRVHGNAEYMGNKETAQQKYWYNVETDTFALWVRPATFGTFKKLYGKINQNLEQGKYQIMIDNYYDVSEYRGKKNFILTTMGPFGTKNQVLPISFLVLGFVELLIAGLFFYKYKSTDGKFGGKFKVCLLYTSPSPRDRQKSRMPSSA